MLDSELSRRVLGTGSLSLKSLAGLHRFEVALWCVCLCVLVLGRRCWKWDETGEGWGEWGLLTEMGSFDLDSDFFCSDCRAGSSWLQMFISISRSRSYLAYIFPTQDTWPFHRLGRKICISWKWDEGIYIYVVLHILHRRKHIHSHWSSLVRKFIFLVFYVTFYLVSREESSWYSHKVTTIHLEPCQSHLGPRAFIWRIYFSPFLPFNIATFSWIRHQCSIPMVIWTPQSTLTFISEDEGSDEVERAKWPASLGQNSSSLLFLLGLLQIY